MSKLAELLNQRCTPANSANPANPVSKISKISNFCRGSVPKTQFLSDDELRSLAGDEWPEISADPAQLGAFKAAAQTIRQLRQGVVPDHYTAITTCKRCGPVPIFPGVPDAVEGCPWCFNRVKGLPVPREGQ